MTSRSEPRPRKDQRCVRCGKPKTPARNGGKVKDGTRMPEGFWLAELAKDPFCSRICLERHHGIDELPAVMECGYVACDKTFPVRVDTPRKRFCSRQCQQASKRHNQRRVAYPPGVCSGCGGDYAESTRGCAQCTERRRSRRRKQDPIYKAKSAARRVHRYATDPDFKARKAARDKAYKARKRAEIKAAA